MNKNQIRKMARVVDYKIRNHLNKEVVKVKQVIQDNRDSLSLNPLVSLVENNPFSKLVELRTETDKQLAKHKSRKKAGKGEWLKPGYIKDDEWNRLDGEYSIWLTVDKILNGEEK